MAIGGGNILLILLGVFRCRYNAPRWFGVASIILGVLGLLSFILESANAIPVQPGIFERGSVYTLIAFQLLAGITRLVSRLRSQRLELGLSNSIVLADLYAWLEAHSGLSHSYL
jgi:hypothetical protein